jgi:hypothetical protein
VELARTLPNINTNTGTVSSSMVLLAGSGAIFFPQKPCIAYVENIITAKMPSSISSATFFFKRKSLLH